VSRAPASDRGDETSSPHQEPWCRTVYGLYRRWHATGATWALHDALRAAARVAAGRHSEPTAAVIDSQSVRAAPTVPKASRGWDNAKKVNV
jgi:hypothetical protein